MAIAGMRLELAEEDRNLLASFADTLDELTAELKRYNDSFVPTELVEMKAQDWAPPEGLDSGDVEIMGGQPGLNHRIQAAEGHVSTWHTHEDLDSLNRCITAFGGQAE